MNPVWGFCSDPVSSQMRFGVLGSHQAVKYPPDSLVQSSRCVKDLAMRPVGASLSPRCGWPLGVGFSAVPRWLPRFPALPSVPAMP